MEIHLEFLLEKKQKDLGLPIQYNHLLQAAIYNSIKSDLADFLHYRGFITGKRTFKLFAFSRLQGNYILDSRLQKIIFTDNIKLIISSPVDVFCQSLANTLLEKGIIRLDNTELNVSGVYVKKYEVKGEQIIINTLSPIVLYSTLYKQDGRKFTYYCQPGEPDYNQLLTSNLNRKYNAFYKKDPPAGEVMAEALGRQRQHIIKYKGTIIKGYSGKLKVSGPSELLQLGIDSGFGSKNSQGFGCVKLL